MTVGIESLERKNNKLICIASMMFSLLVAVSVFLTYASAFDASEDVQFELYTRDNRQVFQLIDTHGEPAIANTLFSASRPTRIFVHGYRSKHKVINRYAEAYLNAGDYNFIAVNWSAGSSTVNYYTAKSRIKDVILGQPQANTTIEHERRFCCSR